MERELSSKWTFFYKFVLPTLWIGMFTLGTLTMFFAPDVWNGHNDARWLRWLFLGLTLSGALFLYWACMRLKKVWLGRTSFTISNYVDEVEVPVRDVERVSGSILMSPELVWLRFRRPTRFGDKVVFMPKLRLLSGWNRHPVVEELRGLITRERMERR